MAFCTKCGKELKDGDKFCYYCGAQVNPRNTTGQSAAQGQASQGKGKDGTPAAGADIKKLTVAVAAAVLVLSGVFIGANMKRAKEPAVQVAADQDTRGVDAADPDAVDAAKETELEEISSEGVSSENQSDKEDTTSGQSYNAQELAMEVIASIESKPRYGTGVSFEPLAAVDDFNGDGIRELLAVYELRNNENTVEVMYGLWSLQGTEAKSLEEGVLFTEVGGNSGIVGIVEREGTIYLAIEWSEPAGELFNKYYSYVPMSKTESALESAWYYMESHGSYTDETAEGRYILGDTKVDKSEFEAKIQEFSDRIYVLDLLNGPGDGVMTFDEMKKSAV